MPAQQLVSSAIRIDFEPCRGNPNPMAYTPPEARMWQPFPNYTKVWTAPTEPLGLAPTESCRALLPLSVSPSSPRPSLPPSSWQVTIQPFGSKEVHRFTGSHSPACDWYFQWHKSMAKQRTVLNRHRRGHQTIHIIFQLYNSPSPPGLNLSPS